MTPRTMRPRTGNPDLDAAIRQLVELADPQHDRDLVAEMIGTSIRMALEPHDRGDLKLVNGALKDFQLALNVFMPHRGSRKCSVFGSARIPSGHPEYKAAVDVGAALAAAGWEVITGGGPGIMTAAVEGAGPEHSFGVTIRLPFETSNGGGIVPEDHLAKFRYFFSRKVTFMKESSAYIVFPGGFGTLDETFELLTLLQTGKEYPCPIVLFQPPGSTYWQTWLAFVEKELVPSGLVFEEDLDLFLLSGSVEASIRHISEFYARFDSMRFVDGQLVLRLTEEISDETLAKLNAEFADVLASGTIERCEASEAEIDDHDCPELPRLRMHFDNRHFARLHQMIRAL